MQIQVTFGLGLDGAGSQGGQASDGLGNLRVGPSGLFEFLELHTGLYGKPFSRIERLSAFLGVHRTGGRPSPRLGQTWRRAGRALSRGNPA